MRRPLRYGQCRCLFVRHRPGVSPRHRLDHDGAVVGGSVKVVRAQVSVCPEDNTPDPSTALRAAREDGDEGAFRVLYRAVQPGLLRYLRALVGEDAEDVASEAWLQIARD